MACGTPVIAFRSGSVPEVIDNGVSGFVVNSVEEAVNAVSGLLEFDRAAVRAAFETRFTVERMAREYLKIYAALPGVGRESVASPISNEGGKLKLVHTRRGRPHRLHGEKRFSGHRDERRQQLGEAKRRFRQRPTLRLPGRHPRRRLLSSKGVVAGPSCLGACVPLS